jgi:hypothetical protein
MTALLVRWAAAHGPAHSDQGRGSCHPHHRPALTPPGRRIRQQQLGDAENVRDRHLAYFLGLAEAAELKLRGPDQLDWLERLEREHANLRAALAWSLAGEDPEAGLRMAGALWYFWNVRAHLSEGRRWVEELSEGADGRAARPPRSPAHARALSLAAYLAFFQGDFVVERAFAEESVAISRQLGDELGLAWSLDVLSVVATFREDHATARAAIETSEATFRAAGGDGTWPIPFSSGRSCRVQRAISTWLGRSPRRVRRFSGNSGTGLAWPPH